MTRLEEQSKAREENARYLTQQLREIPGILPARMHEGCTRNAYHLYMFRYQAGAVRRPAAGALPRRPSRPRASPAPAGTRRSTGSRSCRPPSRRAAYQRLYPKEVLAGWEERNRCPANDRLCEEAVWLTQTMLLGPRQDMDDIAAAIRKIQASAAELAKA